MTYKIGIVEIPDLAKRKFNCVPESLGASEQVMHFV
jgi:hypothetical protein